MQTYPCLYPLTLKVVTRKNNKKVNWSIFIAENYGISTIDQLGKVFHDLCQCEIVLVHQEKVFNKIMYLVLVLKKGLL